MPPKKARNNPDVTMVRMMRSIKQKINQKQIAVFDFETNDWKNPYACGLLYEDRGHDIYALFHGRSPNVWIKELVDRMLSLKGYIIFSHYGGKFDLLFLLNEFYKRTNIETKFIVVQSSIIAIIITFADGEKVQFFDSWRIFQAPLADIGKSINLPKLDLDHKEGSRDKRWRDYLYRDCEILYKAIQGTQRKLEALGSYLKPTAASTAMETYRRKFLPLSFRMEDDGGDWLRQYYCGGRVEVFRVGQVDNVYVYDVNSMYPYVMKHYKYPIGIPVHLTNRERLERYAKNPNYVVFCRAVVNIPPTEKYPPLPVKHQGRLLFPAGKLSGVWDYVELSLCKPEWIETISEGWVYVATDLFSNYIDTFYAMKSKGGIDKIVGKLFLNSLYGKFGEGNIKKAYIFNPQFEDMHQQITNEKITRKPSLEIPELNVWSILSDRLAKHTSVPIAAHVTALARMTLFNYIKEARNSGAEVYYCDTDSVFTNKPVWEDSHELGAMKLEGAYDKGILTAPKMYALINPKPGYHEKIKAKGFRRLTLTEFRNMLNGHKVKIRAGLGQFRGIIREAKKTGKFEVWVAEIDKGLASDYTKRIVMDDNTTWPLNDINPDWSEGIYKRLRELFAENNDD